MKKRHGSHWVRGALIAAATVFLILPDVAAQDLRKVYKGKLDFAEAAGGVDWTADLGDAWRLSSFHFELTNKFELELGPSTVVFGKHGTLKEGASVVWAALFPDEPTAITTSEPGHGDHAKAIFMRFNPSLVGTLFPKDIVTGPADSLQIVWARRQYLHKINASWQWDNMPVVTTTESMVFDIDTVEGKRRMYILDRKKKTVKYEDYFAKRTLPVAPSEETNAAEASEIFEQVWNVFDAEYPMFGVKQDVDWDALAERYAPLTAQAKTSYEVAGVLALLLSHLEDLHVYVKVEDEFVYTYRRFRVRNANWNSVKASLQGMQEQSGLTWAKTNYGLGYLNVLNLTDETMSDAFDQALEELGETVGLILDLRFNGGGNEMIGRRLAGRFLDQERVYSKNQYRKGAERDALGEVLDRSFEPRGPWRYEAPVVVLQGQKTMSSAESLALMFAQCPEVTTMGDRTAGSSANPRRLELPHGIVVNLPRWLDLDAEGEPIDTVGVAPQKHVDATTVADFKEDDPVFQAAVKFLKGKSRKPGKRK